MMFLTPQTAISMKVSVENGKICNQMMMGERLERIGEVWIVDQMDFIKKME